MIADVQTSPLHTCVSWISSESPTISTAVHIHPNRSVEPPEPRFLSCVCVCAPVIIDVPALAHAISKVETIGRCVIVLADHGVQVDVWPSRYGRMIWQ